MQNELRIAIPASLDEKHRVMLAEIAGALCSDESGYAIGIHYATLLVLREERGFITPAEKFVESLLLHWGHGQAPLTPELAGEKLEEFKDDFAEVTGIVRRHTERYSNAFVAADANVAATPAAARGGEVRA